MKSFKRSKYLFLICLSFITKSFSQNVKIEWGEEIENTTKSSIYGIVGQNERSFFHTRVGAEFHKYNEMYLVSNDRSTMRTNFINKLSIPKSQLSENKQFSFITCFIWNNKIYALTSVYHIKEDQKVGLIFEIDPNTGNLYESYSEAGKIENAKTFRFSSFSKGFSSDSSKLMIFSTTLSNDRDMPLMNSISVFESDLRLMYTKSFELKPDGKKLRFTKCIIDNNGNCYRLINVVERKIEDKKKPGYHYVIHAYYPKDSTIKTFDIDVGDNFVCKTLMEVSNDGKLVFAGTYSVSNKYSGLSGEPSYNYSLGLFYSTIDPLNRTLTQIEYMKYDSTFVAIQEKEFNGVWIYKDGEIYGIFPKQIVFNSDGSFKLIVEQSFEEMVSLKSSSYINFNDNTITVFSFDVDTKLSWSETLIKRQRVRDNNFYSSYECFVKNNLLNFIYNDDRDNLNLLPGKKRKVMDSLKGASLMIASIDKNGEQKIKELYDTSNLEFYVMPNLSNMSKDGQIFIYAQKTKGGYKFGKITIE